MQKTQDDALVQDVRSGHREAFTALVRRHQNYAYGTAVGLLSDFELARDVVQESFLIAYQDLGKLREPARFGLWLRGIVRHTALKARRERDKVRGMAEELRQALDMEAPAPDQTDLDEIRRRMVRLALEGLGDSHREIVGLYYTGDMSYIELAAFLGITPTAVQGRLQRARDKLKKELKMVEERFEEEGLPEDFSAEVERLLETSAINGEDLTIDQLKSIGASAVDPLCQIFEDPFDPNDPRVRVAALALCAIGDERALHPLLRVLYTSRAWFFHRHDTEGQGWRPGDWSSISRLLEVPGLRDKMLERVRTRQASWSEVLTFGFAEGDAEVYEAVNALFHQTRDPHMKATALQSLCKIRPGNAGDLIARFLQRDRYYRRAACIAAFYIGSTPPLELCMHALIKGVDDFALGFLIGHIRGHGQQGEEALRQLLVHDSPQARFTAALTLAPTKSQAVFEVLIQHFLDAPADKSWDFKKWRPLGEHYAPQLAAWIEQHPAQSKEVPALVAALAHKGTGPVNTGAAFDTLAREGWPTVQASATKVLTKSRGAAYLPELRHQLAEGRSALSRAAFWSVYRLRTEAEPMVEEMFASKNWKERKAAVCLWRRWNLLTDERKSLALADEHVAVQRAAEPYIKRRRPT